MTLKHNTKNAFTLVELIAVIGIIGLLAALALPAINRARTTARIASDRFTIETLSKGIEAFAGDVGFYPPSGARQPNEFYGGVMQNPLYVFTPTTLPNGPFDQGAHRLFESLAGLDMLGFQKEHHYEVYNGTQTVIGTPQIGTPIAYNKFGQLAETDRLGPYVDMNKISYATMQKAQPKGARFTTLYAPPNPNPVFVGTLAQKENRAILYYKADKNQRDIEKIYHYSDNDDITQDTTDGAAPNGANSLFPNFDNVQTTPYTEFKSYIWDPKTGQDNITGTNDPGNMFASPYARPYNKDTFLLINAGLDNLYGTPDDITNFEVIDKSNL